MNNILDIQQSINPEGYFEDNINTEYSLYMYFQFMNTSMIMLLKINI